MTTDLDDAVRAHLAGMPQATRRLLGPRADWDRVPYGEIRRHAEALLDEDTARLTRSV